MNNIQKIMRLMMLMIVLLFSAQLSYGQFTFSNPTSGDIGYTTNSPAITGIGIGFFNTTNIASALHVNTNLTTAQSGGASPFGLGETFRGQAPSNVTQYWRMLYGTSGGTEVFNINNAGGSAIVTLGTTGAGRMDFQTNATPRMTILGTGSPGYVGIGTNFNNPTSRLTIKEGSNNDAWFQITGDNITSGATHGLRIGVLNSTVPYDAEIKQQENADLNFQTNSLQRATIKADGKVGINTDEPDAKLDVLDASNAQLRLTQADGTVYTDFQTNGSGYLYINPSGSKTGIGNSSPTYTLDVNGDIGMGNSASIYSRISNTPYRAFSISGGSTGYSNLFAGYNAGPTANLSSRNYNVYVGLNAGSGDQGGGGSTFIGANAGFSFTGSTSGTENTLLGYSSGYNLASTGSYNTMVGSKTAYNLPGGDKNTFVGYLAGDYITSSGSDYNVMLGCSTGVSVTGGDDNIFIGRSSGTTASGARNRSVAIGYGTLVDSDDCIALGNGSAQITMGSSTPQSAYRLTVSGNGLSNGNGGYFKTVDQNAYAGYFTNTGNGYSAYFHEKIYLNGNFDGTGTSNYTSDQMFKTNVDTIGNAMSIISELVPKHFYFDTTNVYGMNFSSKKQFGFIAQDLLPVLPELVSQVTKPAEYDSQGNQVFSAVTYKTVNYNALFAILIKGIQEQQEQIEELQGNRTTGSTSPNSGTIELEDMATLQLLQNDPNPFSESTMIRWNIPGEFQNAVIYFYDNSGNQINTYKVNAKGAGELQVFGSKLSQGVYTYTLVVDGKMIDSKKMLKSK